MAKQRTRSKLQGMEIYWPKRLTWNRVGRARPTPVCAWHTIPVRRAVSTKVHI